MMFHPTFFFFVLTFNLICGHVLINKGKNALEWPFEYLFKQEISDVETAEKKTNKCDGLPCKILAKNSTKGSPLILTSYIESGELEKARNLSKVDPTFFAGVNSHAAYFTVNKTKKWHLFFWYFPAEGVPLESTPLLIWFNGGPGCSSLTGLFVEIGPLQFKNGKEDTVSFSRIATSTLRCYAPLTFPHFGSGQLKLLARTHRSQHLGVSLQIMERMPITWGSNYSLLFIDSPVGTGFSYTEDPRQYATNEDMVGESLLNFLQQFLEVFPELRKAPLFLTGESYAGKYIPAFGHYIHNNNKNNSSLPINLKGLAIGDGWSDPPTLLHYSEWALQVGLIDPEVFALIHSIEEDARRCWDQHNTTCFAQNAGNAFIVLSNYAPVNPYNYVNDTRPAKEHVTLLNKPEIQEAIHAKRQRYLTCSVTPNDYLMDDIYRSVKPWLEELVEHYGVMCYSGQLDMIVAYALSVHTYRSLKWSGQEGYLNATRVPIYNEDGYLVNSFIKASGNFMDVMVRSAGHLVPTDQPVAAKQIIDMFIKKFK